MSNRVGTTDYFPMENIGYCSQNALKVSDSSIGSTEYYRGLKDGERRGAINELELIKTKWGELKLINTAEMIKHIDKRLGKLKEGKA